jgi:hypothetical protein
MICIPLKKWKDSLVKEVFTNNEGNILFSIASASKWMPILYLGKNLPST